MAQPEQPKPPQAASSLRQALIGIDPSVRKRAEAAARRAGMSLDEWFNSTIVASASEFSLIDAGSKEIVDTQQRIDALTLQLAHLSHSMAVGRAQAGPNAAPQPTTPTPASPSGWWDPSPGSPEPAPFHEESERLRDIADLLGGRKVVGKYPADPLAAHEMLERGLPNTAVKHLLDGMTTLSQKSIEGALGMSERTRQRREKHPKELLSQDQAGRTWKFAEILTRAILVFGSRTAAEQWLAQPATGLEQRRPIDLLTTPAGVELVEDFLGRIEYGVYT